MTSMPYEVSLSRRDDLLRDAARRRHASRLTRSAQAPPRGTVRASAARLRRLSLLHLAGAR